MTGIHKFILCGLLASPFASPAQRFEIGAVDYYGLRGKGAPSKKSVDACLRLAKGDTIDAVAFRKEPVVACLRGLASVKQADLNLVCCTQDNKLMVFVGITNVEKKVIKEVPYKKELHLPMEIIAAHDTLTNGMIDALSKGQASENDQEGHTLFQFPGADRQQKKFIAFANDHVTELRNVLHQAGDAKQRAVASWILPYYRDKREVVPDLVSAAMDPDAEVRNNAIRGLGIMLDFFYRKGIPITIDATPFIDLMKSVDWSDRNKSAFLLEKLTRKRDPAVLGLLKKECVLPLADMAVWQSPAHAYPAFVVLGRVAGWTEQVIYQRSQQDRTKWAAEMVKKMGVR